MILKNDDMRLIVIGDVKLLPGCNDVDDEILQSYSKKSKEYKNGLYNLDEIFQTCNIVKIEEKDEKGNNLNFTDFPMSKKEDIVNNTFHIKTLENWRLVEKDSAIKILIEDRLNGIKNKTITDVKNYGRPKNHT